MSLEIIIEMYFNSNLVFLISFFVRGDMFFTQWISYTHYSLIEILCLELSYIKEQKVKLQV